MILRFVLLLVFVTTAGCSDGSAGKTPPDPNVGSKVITDKSGKSRGAVEDSVPDPNAKR